MTELSQTTITFGKYKNNTLEQVLKDRQYCKWLIEQDWFKNNYEFLFNRIKTYKPLIFFIKEYNGTSTDFIDTFPYFNLINIEDIKLNLTEEEKKCYQYYLKMSQELKQKILDRQNTDNPYNIKAPVKWLLRFEKESGLKRKSFKSFLSSYELINIPYIVEKIKKERRSGL